MCVGRRSGKEIPAQEVVEPADKSEVVMVTANANAITTLANMGVVSGPSNQPGGALGYLGGCIRSLSKLKNTPKALIYGQKSTLILIKR